MLLTVLWCTALYCTLWTLIKKNLLGKSLFPFCIIGQIYEYFLVLAPSCLIKYDLAEENGSQWLCLSSLYVCMYSICLQILSLNFFLFFYFFINIFLLVIFPKLTALFGTNNHKNQILRLTCNSLFIFQVNEFSLISLPSFIYGHIRHDFEHCFRPLKCLWFSVLPNGANFALIR